MTFGINSGAYVAEIFRSGILSVDVGQMEAGRSLGLGSCGYHDADCHAAGHQELSAGAWSTR